VETIWEYNHKWEDDIETDLRGRVCQGIKYIHQVQDSCEYSNEVAGSPKGEKFMGHMSE
jgi:hypothetical protein